MSGNKYTLKQIQVELDNCSVEEDYAKRPLTDQLLIKAILIEGDCPWCFVSIDTTELNTYETSKIRKKAAAILEIPYENLWIHFTHTHAAWYGFVDFDVKIFSASVLSAIEKLKSAKAEPVDAVSLLTVDTGNKYTINRRAYLEGVGSISAYQATGCEDDGEKINAAEEVRERLGIWGAKKEALGNIKEVLLDGQVEGVLQLLIFALGDKPVTGIVRFNSHPVILSSGYYKPNFSRDYCGVLCDNLAEMWKCPIFFMQGPAGNQRTRHKVNTLEQCEQLGKAIANELDPKKHTVSFEPLDQIMVNSKTFDCSIHEYLSVDKEKNEKLIEELNKEIDLLKLNDDYLKNFKLLVDKREILKMLEINISVIGLVNQQDIDRGYREMEISAAKFGNFVFCTANSELANFFSLNLYEEFDSDKLIVGAYTNGIDGYIIEQWDYDNGGYEQAESMIKPENTTKILSVAKELISALKK